MSSLIFVYGSLKRNGWLHHYIQNQIFIGEAETEPKYRLYSLGAYPGMVEDENGIGILGEVWEVSKDILSTLDRVEGRAYIRKSVFLKTLPEKNVETYIYTLNTSSLRECGICWKV